MQLNSQLTELETSGLVQLIKAQPDLEYIFRHGLIQEAAYDSLLKSDRRKLHLAVGEALERLYPDRREELASRLAVHFSEAGEAKRASEYFFQAGDRAARGFANQESVNLYTRALSQISGDSLARIKGLKARAGIYEIMGEFEKADHDLMDALQEARASEHTKDEWQVLLDLGLLWAARDYERTGEFYRQALLLAERRKTRDSLAHSLNRMGNWYINAEQSDEGLQYHQQALDIFNELSDVSGISETLDYLGLSTTMRGEYEPAEDYINRSLKLFDQLGNRRGYISSNISMSLLNSNYQGESFLPLSYTLADGSARARQAAKDAHEIGWRAGEMWALCCQTLNDGARGEYQTALESAQRTLQIGREIDHKQWLTMIHTCMGVLNYDLYSMDKAQEYLERAVDLARSVRSQHWMHVSGGFLAHVYLAQGKTDQAEALMDATLRLEEPARTMGQRLVWCGRIELALNRNQPEKAFEYLEKMKACTFQFTPEAPILLIDLLEGQAYTMKAGAAEPDEQSGFQNEAERAFRKAQRVAEAQGSLSKLWRIHEAIAQLYLQMGREPDAQVEYAHAQKIIHTLADKIQDPILKASFLKNNAV